ncbi:MAG: hypothetical protein LBV12_09710 [Puniceicoccales bacterium]|nr:hypothetical protein [Puniceicoccales bacterium]
MAFFHSPLGLRHRIQAPDTRIDAMPLVTCLLLAVILTLAGSRFIYSPGLTVDLGNEDGKIEGSIPMTLNLPQSRLPLAGIQTGATLTVLTAKSGNMLIFEGRIYSLDDKLKGSLEEAAKESPVLLLKADRSIGPQTLWNILDFAMEAGFKKIQLAGEKTQAQ